MTTPDQTALAAAATGLVDALYDFVGEAGHHLTCTEFDAYIALAKATGADTTDLLTNSTHVYRDEEGDEHYQRRSSAQHEPEHWPHTDGSGRWCVACDPVEKGQRERAAQPEPSATLDGEVFNVVGGNRVTVGIELDPSLDDADLWREWGHQRVTITKWEATRGE